MKKGLGYKIGAAILAVVIRFLVKPPPSETAFQSAPARTGVILGILSDVFFFAAFGYFVGWIAYRLIKGKSE
ncbi:MAG: hypothetical protein ACUZ8I_12560 [Candidatus Scalindua sp.]